MQTHDNIREKVYISIYFHTTLFTKISLWFLTFYWVLFDNVKLSTTNLHLWTKVLKINSSSIQLAHSFKYNRISRIRKEMEMKHPKVIKNLTVRTCKHHIKKRKYTRKNMPQPNLKSSSAILWMSYSSPLSFRMSPVPIFLCLARSNEPVRLR